MAVVVHSVNPYLALLNHGELLSRYTFDGTTMYANFPGWTPNGLPFSVEVSAVLLSDINGTLVGSASASTQAPYYAKSTGAVESMGWTRTDASVGIFVGPDPAHGLNEPNTYIFTATAENSISSRNGVDGNVYGPPAALSSDSVPIGAIASRSNTGVLNPWHGPIYNLKLTDNSPLQNRYTLDGDGVRYVSIPAFSWGDADEISLRASVIRRDSTAGESSVAVLGLLGDGTTYLMMRDSNHPTQPNAVLFSVNGALYLVNNALQNVAQGQHIDLRVYTDAGVTYVEVDGGLIGSAAHPIGASSFDMIGAWSTGPFGQIPINSALGDVILENLTTGEYVEYRIDEGSGTEVKAYDQAGNVIGLNAGIINPDAAWTDQPDNSRFYPMNEGERETFACYDGTGKQRPEYNGTIFNFNEDNWS